MNQEPPTAFPWTHDNMTCTGMTLRDYFAAKAMQAFISSWVSRGDYPATDMVVVEHAYSMADAMMKAREA
jgi:hypothetical protein